MGTDDAVPSSDLGFRPPTRKTGDERFRLGSRDLDASVSDFWRWSASDLLSNATRGILAEYIVARALGLVVDVRAEWDPYDLETADGTKIEVKSTSHLQVWAQTQHTSGTFGIAPTRAWNPSTGKRDAEARRQADVYVFCVLGEKDPDRVDPLDLDQWEFFVLATQVLDARCPAQKSIALSRLRPLGATIAAFGDLRRAVAEAMGAAPGDAHGR